MELRSLEMDLTNLSGSTIDFGDPSVNDPRVSVFGFENTGIIFGEENIEYDSAPIWVHHAVQGFHFETENDHNLAKLKLEVRLSREENRLNILALAAFRDNSPEDDFLNKPFIMKVKVLIFAEF